jgi:hypothetical protein
MKKVMLFGVENAQAAYSATASQVMGEGEHSGGL